MADLSEYKNVWCIAEARAGKVSPSFYELITLGKKVSEELKEPLCVVILGKGLDPLLNSLKLPGISKIYAADHESLEHFNDQAYAHVLNQLIQQEKPNKIFFSSSNAGRSLAPRVAVLAKTGLASEVSEVSVSGQTLKMKRGCNGGTSFMEVIAASARPEMATMRASAFPKTEESPDGKTEIVKASVDLSNSNIKTTFKEFKASQNEEKDVTEADIIVSGGYGFGGEDGFKIVSECANLLGGAVGASRRAVDSGWISYSHQVGLTGKVVCPKVYIACAISGQIQHLAGMSQSQNIVAINKDPEAPMMQLADLSLEGDVFEILPALIQELKNS